MLTAQLEISFGPTPQRPGAAWLINSPSPQVWVAELARWETEFDALTLYVLPRAANDRRPRALLVVPPRPASVPSTVLCKPYSCVARQLYLPVEARLEPATSEQELHGLLAGDDVFVFHPTVGLVRFAPGEARCVADLFKLPRRRTTAWNAAQPGPAINRRLLSIEPERQLTLELIIEQGRDDIGSDSHLESLLPPAPGEPRNDPLSNSARRAMQGFANLAGWLTQFAPQISQQPTWVNKLEDWARRTSQGLSERLETARNRELNRLMHLLESDPDKGLRFAIPLGGAAHRGLARPGWRLFPRDPIFNLGRSGGGMGAADIWHLSPQYRQRLTELYRELANREIRLGRHRRAAFIFGELLHDLSSAAATLRDGKHYREAALIYREKLKRPLDAARCLRSGGLFAEATELYMELEAFEDAGDLYLELGQHEEAKNAYRLAVDRRRKGQDYLGAARLLEQKLAAPDEAVETLSAGWPHSKQAGSCLQELFDLFARLARHRDASARVKLLLDQADVVLSVPILSRVVSSYPDEQVTAEAADAARVLTAARLPHAQSTEAKLLLDAVARLASEDRLLARDCGRYLQGARAALVQKTMSVIADRDRLKLVREFALPDGIEWRSMASVHHCFFAAGIGDGAVWVARVNWHGQIEYGMPKLPARCQPAFAHAPLLLTADPHGRRKLLVSFIGANEPFPTRLFPATDQFPNELLVGPPPEFEGVLALDRTDDGRSWAIAQRGGQLVLLGWSADDKLMVNHNVAVASSPGVLPHLHARSDLVFVAIGNQLHVFQAENRVRTLEMPSAIRGLSGSPPHTRARVAVSLEDGVQLLWAENLQRVRQTLSPTLSAPFTCFTRGGHLIVAGDTECHVYQTKGENARFVAFHPLSPPPVAVLPTAIADEFAVCIRMNKVQIFQVPISLPR